MSQTSDLDGPENIPFTDVPLSTNQVSVSDTDWDDHSFWSVRKCAVQTSKQKIRGDSDVNWTFTVSAKNGPETKTCDCICNAPVSGNKPGTVRRVTARIVADGDNFVTEAEILVIGDDEDISVSGTTRAEKLLGKDSEEGSVVLIAEFTQQDYTFAVVFDEDFTKVITAALVQPLDVLALTASANAPPPPDGQPILNVSAFTDTWGCNLGEMAASVRYTGGLFPNGYLGSNLVASLLPNTPAANPLDGVYQTLYSARPDLQAVLDGNGSSLLEQTNGLNEEDPSGYDNGEFYARIIAYSTLKYFLAGLISNGKFNDKWLLGKYNECFLKKLSKSKFRYYLQFFVDPKYGFVGLNRYFLEDINGCLVCLN